MSSQEVKDAGRGVFFIAGAKLYFMLAGAVLVFSLPGILDEATYGAYLLVAGVASVVNNIMVTGTIQTVARFTAQVREEARAIQRAGFRMHLVFGLPIAIAFAVAGAPIMSRFFHDESKAGPLALSALIVCGYAFYAVFVGTANGLRAFHKQAGLDVSFATLRVTGIVGMAAAGLGVYGAIGGWIGAVAVILAIAALWIGLPGQAAASQPAQRVRPMLVYFLGVAAYLGLLNLIMYLDIFLLKRFSVEAFLAHGMTAEKAATAADAQVGYYGAAQQFGRLSYQAILAATFVIFPLISRSTFDNERDTTIRYIRTTNRYSLIFAAAFAVVFAANPHPILDLPFRIEYADNAAAALVALALGNVAFSLFAIVGTILNGAGKTLQAIAMAAITVVSAAIGNYVVLPRFSPGPDALLACATVTASAMFLGTLVGGALMQRTLGAFIAPLTAVRVIVSGAVAMTLGHFLPFTSRLMTLVEAALVGGTFLAMLVLTRELGRRDLGAILALRRGRQPSASPSALPEARVERLPEDRDP